METTKARRKRFLNDLCKSLGIYDRRDVRRSLAAQAYISFGEQQCRAWLDEADGDYRKWEHLVQKGQGRTESSGGEISGRKLKAKKTSKSARKAEARQLAIARQEEALRRIARFTDPNRMKGPVNATVRGNDPDKELAILLKQLEKAKNQGDRASTFKQESLKERIAFLKAVINSPKIYRRILRDMFATRKASADGLCCTAEPIF